MQKEMDQTIEDMNKCIADFMGYYFHAGKFYTKGGGRGKWFKEAKYHTSWDWLKPVIDKIGGIITNHNHHSIDIQLLNESECNTFMHMTIFVSPKTAHEEVYKFITWYNQQKQTNEQSPK